LRITLLLDPSVGACTLGEAQQQARRGVAYRHPTHEVEAGIADVAIREIVLFDADSGRCRSAFRGDGDRDSEVMPITIPG
jgi:hypothetical protein